MILKLRRQDVDLLKAEANKMFPIEACAMLFGEMTRKKAVVKQVVLVSNKLQSTVRFEMDPEKFVSAFFEAEKKGLDLIGLFHSHPAPAKPSSIDLEGMRLWANVIWLIFSSIDGKLAGYQMKNDNVVEVALEVAP